MLGTETGGKFKSNLLLKKGIVKMRVCDIHIKFLVIWLDTKMNLKLYLSVWNPSIIILPIKWIWLKKIATKSTRSTLRPRLTWDLLLLHISQWTVLCDTSSKEDVNRGRREMFHGWTFRKYCLQNGKALPKKRRSITKKVTRLESSRGMNSWTCWIKSKRIRKFQALMWDFSKRDMPPFQSNSKTKNPLKLRNGYQLNGKRSTKSKGKNFKQNTIAKKPISIPRKTMS